jgi:hypothetical protein
VRVCDAELRRRGVLPLPFSAEGRRMFQALANRGLFSPDAGDEQIEGEIPDGT